MEWVIHYDVAAIALDIIVAAYFFRKRNLIRESAFRFELLLLTNIVASSTDIITVRTYGMIEDGQLSVAIGYIVSMMYFMSVTLMPIMMFLYMLSVVKEKDVSIIEKIWTIGVVSVEFVLIVTTPITHLLFHFDKYGRYQRDAGQQLLYFLSLVTLIFCIYVTIKNKYKLRATLRWAIYLYSVITCSVVLIQFYFYELLLTNFSCAVSILLVYLSIENPEMYFDQKTGFNNKNAFLSHMNMAISHKRKFTIVVFEIDGFNYIMDMLGNENAQELISIVAEFIGKAFNDKDIYFMSGIRFAIVTYDNDEEEIATNIREKFSSSIVIAGVNVVLNPLICFAKYPENIWSASEILSTIEYTFTEQREAMDNKNFYINRDFLNKKQREVAITHIIKQALANDGFRVYYQPILNTRTGTYMSAEALVRLVDNELGFISPEEFIPIAEKNGKILQLGEIVFENVCRFLSEGTAEKYGIEYIEVNLSVVQCMQENLAEKLIEIMDKYGIEYSKINLEITETANFDDNEMMLNNMNKLIDKGISFSMDDYGTGFSTSNYLIELPYKIVKIDKSIIWAAMKNEKALYILRYTVSMIRSLELEIVAEGVEDQEMAEILMDMGCDYLQGFLYSRPVPEKEYIEFMKNTVN